MDNRQKLRPLELARNLVLASMASTKFSYANRLFYMVLMVTICRCAFGYFIPLQILVNAPHDDYLFIRLAKSISDFEWLGNYDQYVLIKGAGYPLFLALANWFFLPLRLAEALFICGCTYYFISAPAFKHWNVASKVIVFALIVFVPFQYGALDFRILRDMIYPWILLALIGCGLRLLSHEGSYRSLAGKALLFGVLFGYFDIVREETIWVAPAVAFGLAVSAWISFTKKSPQILVIVASGVVGFTIVVSLISLANYHKFESTIRAEFRDGYFSYGYGSLFRFKSEKAIPRASLNDQDWARLFENIPASRVLSKYVNSNAYRGWVGTACEAIRSQHPWEDNSECDEVMLNGYLFWALKDAVYALGYASPASQSVFWKTIGDEINTFCAKPGSNCAPRAVGMMPPETLSLEALDATIKNIPRAAVVLVNSNMPNVSGWAGSGSFTAQQTVAENYSSYFLYSKKPSMVQYPTEMQQKLLLEEGIGKGGIIDGVTFADGKILFYGWVEPTLESPEILIEARGMICSVKPSLRRPDIAAVDYDLGFVCEIPAILDIEQGFKGINFESKILAANGVFSLVATEAVTKKMQSFSTIFDEDCYIERYPDVKQAVIIGQFSSGFDHFKKHGYKENRKCANSEFLFDANSLLESGFSVNRPDENLAIMALNFLGESYKTLSKFGFFLVPVALLFAAITMNFFVLGSMIVFGGLALTRVILISLLDYTGMAPVSALYLFSGSVMWFCMVGLAVGYLSNFVLRKVAPGNA